MPPSPLTQDERYQLVVNAIWFSAQCYVPPADGKPLLAMIDVAQTAHSVIGMLDDLDQIRPLP